MPITDQEVVELALHIAAATFARSERPDLAAAFGLRIRHFRRLRHFSQAMLGHPIHVSRQAIAKFEAGRAVLPASRIPLLCAALGISPSELFEYQNHCSQSHR